MEHWMLSLYEKYILTFSFPLVKWLEQTPSFLLFKWYGEVEGCSNETYLLAGQEKKRAAGKCQLIWWKRVPCLDPL